MYEIAIDESSCKRCGLCALTCAHAILRQEEKRTVPGIFSTHACLGCGQCVAMCPSGALTHSAYPDGSIKPTHPENQPDYDQLMELLRSRRSRRQFKSRELDRADLEKVLEAARFAPSGHNEQSTHFTVVQGRQAVREVAEASTRFYEDLSKKLGGPVGRFIFRMMAGKRTAEIIIGMLPEIEGVVSEFRAGTDYILNDAPSLIVFHADSTAQYPSENANLAIQNAALAAETLGLGCFYCGFVLAAAKRDDAVAQHLGLPEGHQVCGVLALGHPRVTFGYYPEREPARIHWVGAA